ncbi:hypothetical protein D9M68_752590 [compost metagenome]
MGSRPTAVGPGALRADRPAPARRAAGAGPAPDRGFPHPAGRRVAGPGHGRRDALPAERGLSHRDQRSGGCGRHPRGPRVRPPVHRPGPVRAAAGPVPGQPGAVPRYRLRRRGRAHRPPHPAEHRPVLPDAERQTRGAGGLPGAVQRVRQHDRAPLGAGRAGQLLLRGGEGRCPGTLRRVLQG